jgi:hypothetical protein
MRRHWIFAAGLAVAASAGFAPPAPAELNAYYKGVDRTTGKDVPASIQISLAPGRVAVLVKGTLDARILFREELDSLRFVDEAAKSYFDVAHCASADSAVRSDIEGQLSMLTPEQRQMAEGLLQEALGSEAMIPQTEYVPTGQKRKVLGYECTMIDVKENDEKFADYCGCTSKDFKLSDSEAASVQALQRCLVGLAGLKPAAGTAIRTLWWDPDKGGFPLVTRCVEGEKVTFEVTLVSFDRKTPPADPFVIPPGYARVETPALPEPEEEGD